MPGDGLNCPNLATSVVTVRYQLSPEGRVRESTCFECDEHRGAFVASPRWRARTSAIGARINDVSTQVF